MIRSEISLVRVLAVPKTRSKQRSSARSLSDGRRTEDLEISYFPSAFCQKVRTVVHATSGKSGDL